MRKHRHLTRIVSITANNGKALRRIMNDNTRVQGVAIKRPGEPIQYRVTPTGPDAA